MAKEVEPMYRVHIDTRREKKHSWEFGRTSTMRPYNGNPKIKYLPAGEWSRRDSIIRNEFLKCEVRPGDTVRPIKDETFKKDGLYRIRLIDKSWEEYCGIERDETKVEWPKNDCPMIVHASSLRTGNAVIATANWFKRATPEEIQACQQNTESSES